MLAPKILTHQIDMILEIEQYKDDRHPTQIFFLDEKEKYGQTGTEICLLDSDGRIQNQTYDYNSATVQKDSTIWREPKLRQIVMV
jgi:hypothetical protein